MELFAVKYGENFKYASYKTIYKGDNRTALVPEFVFLYYIAKIHGKVILFDTGFRNKETAEGYGVTLFDVKEEVLALTEERVDAVFITHAHFDHVENLDLYPSAELIASCATWMALRKDYPHLVALWADSDKLHLVDKELVYQDLFRFTVINGHMNGSSVIYIDEKDTKYVLAGDEAYLGDNFSRNIPNGMTFDLKKNAAFIESIHRQKIIPLPYHDAAIMTRYPKVSEHIVRIF